MSGGKVGIDPDRMQQLIAQLSGAARDFENLASQMRQIAARAGLSGTRGMAVGQKGAELKGKLPGLRARLDLAREMNKTAPPGTVVWFPASAVAPFLHRQEQRQAGEKAAQDYTEGKIDHNQLFALLRSHKGDRYWAAGFWARLGWGGPDGLAELEQVANNAPGNYKAADVAALAQSVANAMGSGVRFLPSGNSVRPGDMAGAIDDLAPLLSHASFSPASLEAIGSAVMNVETFTAPSSPISASTTADVWRAVASNPAASADLMRDHLDQMQQYSTDQGGGADGDAPLYAVDKGGHAAEAFANVIRSATIPPPGASPQRTTACNQNTIDLVTWWNHQDGKTHTIEPVQQAYADIIKTHWSDLQWALTAPATRMADGEPGTPQVAGLRPGGVSLQVYQWKAFVDETMRNPTACTDLLALAHGHGQALVQAGGFSGSGLLKHYQGERIIGFFDHEADGVYAEMPKNPDGSSDWQNAAKSATKTALSWASAGITVGPEGALVFGAAGATVSVAKSLILDGPDGESGINGLINGWSPATRGGTYTPPNQTWQSNWSGEAFDLAQRYPGIGDPGKYEKEFGPNATFTDGQDHVLPVSEFDHNPSAMRAFDAWLQDPAVVNKIAPEFGASDRAGYDEPSY